MYLTAVRTSLIKVLFYSSFVSARYEAEGRYRKQVNAQKLWFAILEAQIETGNPYMLYKDSCNRKSNQKVNSEASSFFAICFSLPSGCSVISSSYAFPLYLIAFS